MTLVSAMNIAIVVLNVLIFEHVLCHFRLGHKILKHIEQINRSMEDKPTKKKNDGVTAINRMLQPAKSPIGHSAKHVTQP